MAVGKKGLTNTTTIKKQSEKKTKKSQKKVGEKRTSFRGKSATSNKSVEPSKKPIAAAGKTTTEPAKKPVVASKDLKKRVVKAEAKTKASGKQTNGKAAKPGSKADGFYLTSDDLNLLINQIRQ